MLDKSHSKELAPIPPELIAQKIYLIRGKKVMLDSDLAELYQVLTKNLNLAVRRNPDRFPEGFMFQLTKQEAESLRLQTATSKTGRGGRRYLPYVFTDYGVVQLASVLNSERATQMSIFITTVFVRLRDILAHDRDLAEKIARVEETQEVHASHISDHASHISNLYHLVKRLTAGKRRRRNPIGFITNTGKK